MVAGIQHLSQSIDLIEGHRVVLLEPHPKNAEARQAVGRFKRPGQKSKRITVVWLLHKGSLVEENLYSSNVFKDDIERAVRLSKVNQDTDDMAGTGVNEDPEGMEGAGG